MSVQLLPPNSPVNQCSADNQHEFVCGALHHARNHGRIKSLAGHTVYAYSSGLRVVQFLLRNYATRVDKKGIAPEQGFILWLFGLNMGSKSLWRLSIEFPFFK